MNPTLSPVRAPAYPAPSAPPAEQASNAPLPYQASAQPHQSHHLPSAPPGLGAIGAQNSPPPSYVASVINVHRDLRPGRQTNLNRTVVLQQTFRELFEGTVAGFSRFDYAERDQFMARPADARRMMAAIELFDVSIAELFENIPALAKCVKRGKVKHPVVEKMIQALTLVERELAKWVPPPNGSLPSYVEIERLSHNPQVVPNLLDDLRALNIALQHFQRHGTLSNEIDLPGIHEASRCTVL